jgi:Tfp pilus assembly protein PilV
MRVFLAKKDSPKSATRLAQHEKGFTLVETLVASFVLMFGLLGLASLLSYAVATNFENKTDAFATTLAVRKLEDLKGQPPAALADGGRSLDSSGNIDFNAAATVGYSQTVTGAANQSFDLRWNVTAASGLRKIVVGARRNNGTRRLLTNVLTPVNVRCFKQS